MTTETFIIKSLYIQNTIMLIFLGVVVSFLIHSLTKRKPKRIGVFTIWLFLVLWFFNSPFFGFSAVSVSPQGIKLNYGILSFRNELLPVKSEWKVETSLSGIRKKKRLYFISIAGHQSMKVKGGDKLRLLQSIGKSIDRMKSAKQRT
ncbi:MAG: hypothetical protein JSW15_03485 [Deltaproteobacteria bacterium]|nr:MAG: hypothetical protein JSW15_03485 [Deltaproteobacteria bacterium]